MFYDNTKTDYIQIKISTKIHPKAKAKGFLFVGIVKNGVKKIKLRL